MELLVFIIDPKYLNEFTYSNCSSPVFKQVSWNIFLVQYRYLVLLLFTIGPAFSASCLSLQKVSIEICFVLPVIRMQSAQAQICFNLVVIFPRTSVSSACSAILKYMTVTCRTDFLLSLRFPQITQLISREVVINNVKHTVYVVCCSWKSPLIEFGQAHIT